MKAVLDTNVLMAAFGTRGLCESLVAVCLDSHQLILSDHILEELRRGLAGKFKVPAKQVAAIVGFLRDHAQLVVPRKLPPNACRNADDVVVLGTALAGKADCLVTGDQDLLMLGRFQDIPIMSPRAFYDALRG